MKHVRSTFSPFLFFVMFGGALQFCGVLAQATTNESFTYTEDVDPMSDEDTSFIYTEEISPESSTRTGLLVWRCLPDGLNIYVSADEYLNSDDPVAVRYRFGSNPVEDWQMWDISTNGTAAFIPVSFVDAVNQKVAKAEKMTLQVVDYSDETYTYVFNLGGFSEALANLSCAL